MIVGELDFGFSNFYQYLVKKGTGKIIQGNAWRPHVTIFDGRSKLSDEAMKLWKKYDGKVIKIKYNVDITKHWKFWVMAVECDFFALIRKELGLKSDNYPFHITIGRDY
jgi:2'-5' RNA ligase